MGILITAGFQNTVECTGKQHKESKFLHFSKIQKARLIYSTTSTFAKTFRRVENIVDFYFIF